MPSAFDVLGRDHEEVKRMCTKLEVGPTVSTGASGAEAHDLGQRLLQAKRAAFAQPTSRRLRGAA